MNFIDARRIDAPSSGQVEFCRVPSATGSRRWRDALTGLAGTAMFGLLTANSALAGPVCTTSVPIAVPSGMPGILQSGVDKDLDGILDIAEDELLKCAVPIFRFDTAENALEPNEPVVVSSITPRVEGGAFDVAGRLVLRISSGELYAYDGGYIWCDFPQLPQCNDHVGDSQGRDIDLVVTGLTTAVIVDPIADVDSGPPTFQGTHLVVYPSAGKHHGYFSPLEGGHFFSSYDCDGCGLGHWDRANGNGVERHPVPHNAGQAESFPYCGLPSLTPNGFMNHLAGVGMPSEYVYDPCSDLCDNGKLCSSSDSDPGWKAFFGDDEDITALHSIVVHPANKQALHVQDVGGVCTYGASANGPDGDGDGVPNACDSCPTFANPTQLLVHVDSDSDGRNDACDNCDFEANPNQQDVDYDGVGDACDNCRYVNNPDQANHDSDAHGDLCDPDDDNDGCTDVTDQHPLMGSTEIGTYVAPLCAEPKPILGFEGDDTDHDGQRNCHDADDDNDQIPDDLDPCPNQDGELCILPGQDCPLDPRFDICRLGGCEEFVLQVKSNPDPTKVFVFEKFWIDAGKLYVGQAKSTGLRRLASQLTLGAPIGSRRTAARIDPPSPAGSTLRLEVWTKTARGTAGRFVATVASYDPDHVRVDRARRGNAFELTLQGSGAPLLVRPVTMTIPAREVATEVTTEVTTELGAAVATELQGD